MDHPYRGELEALAARCDALERALREAQAQAEDAERLRGELARARQRLARLERRARPWWRSPWALALYGVALAGFVLRPFHVRAPRSWQPVALPPDGRCTGAIDRRFEAQVKTVHGAAGDVQPGATCSIEIQGAGGGSCGATLACGTLPLVHVAARCSYELGYGACSLVARAPGFSIHEASGTGWLVLGASELELRLPAP